MRVLSDKLIPCSTSLYPRLGRLPELRPLRRPPSELIKLKCLSKLKMIEIEQVDCLICLIGMSKSILFSVGVIFRLSSALVNFF